MRWGDSATDATGREQGPSRPTTGPRLCRDRGARNAHGSRSIVPAAGAAAAAWRSLFCRPGPRLSGWGCYPPSWHPHTTRSSDLTSRPPGCAVSAPPGPFIFLGGGCGHRMTPARASQRLRELAFGAPSAHFALCFVLVGVGAAPQALILPLRWLSGWHRCVSPTPQGPANLIGVVAPLCHKRGSDPPSARWPNGRFPPRSVQLEVFSRVVWGGFVPVCRRGKGQAQAQSGADVSIRTPQIYYTTC